jgi:hypothetical protein
VDIGPRRRLPRLEQGIQAGQASRETVNGVPAVASTFQAQTEQGVIQGLVAFFTYNGTTYQVIGYSPQQKYGNYANVFRQSMLPWPPLLSSEAKAPPSASMR